MQTLHVKVNSYDGTCSRSSLESGAVVDVVDPFGTAEEDSQRTADSVRTRGKICEGRAACDVRGVWRRRFVGAGMCSAGAALSECGAETRANARNKEDADRIAIVYGLPRIEIAVTVFARAGWR